MNASSGVARGLVALVRWAAPAVASLSVACGGGGTASSGAEIPTRMTLSATVLDAHTVQLQWSGLSAAPTSYSLHVDGTFYRTEYPSSASSTAERSRVGSLDAGRRYCFVVYAVYFPLGVASRSDEACVTTPPDAAPGAPSTVSAVAISPARIDVTWSAAGDDWGVAQYRIGRDGTPIGSVAGAMLTFEDTTVIPATRYCYTVSAVDTGGNASPPSPPACATPPADTQRPAAPPFLDVAIDGAVATLAWGASSDDGALAYYRILRNGTVLRTVLPVSGDSLSVTDTGLAAGTQYCYEVVAVDRANNASAPSPRACTTAGWTFATIAQATDARDEIGPGSVALDGAGRLHVAYGLTPWNAGANVAGPTELHYLSDAGGTWTERALPASIDAPPSIAVAGSAVHVGYRQVRAYCLDLSSLLSEPVGTETPRELALAADRDGVLQMALAGSSVRYAVRTPGGWTVAPVSPVYALALSLALARSGTAHVAFRDASASALYHATNAGGAWTVSPLIEGAVGSYFFPAIATDSTGAVHVAYDDEVNGRVMHATNRSGAWIHTVVDGVRSAGPIAVAIGARDSVHVAYPSAGSATALKYAHDRDGAWRSVVLAQVTAIRSVSLVVDAGGRPSIVYSGYGSTLRLATTTP